jgi:hypothetical protein
VVSGQSVRAGHFVAGERTEVEQSGVTSSRMTRTGTQGKTKEDRKRLGPKPFFSAQKKRAVAQAAMALKRRGVEPSYSEVVAKAPKAILNPDTNEPFTPKYVMQVFKELCFDDDAADPWGHMMPYQKTALPQELIAQRVLWVRKMRALGQTAAWFFKNVIWVDPCATIIPGGARTAFHQGKSRAGKSKRWMSPKSREYSRNLRAAPYADKQKAWGDGKLWWFVVVTRGVVKFEVMGADWGQTGDGMAEFVQKLPGALTKMLGHGTVKPKVIMSDRGPGFYQSSRGVIVDKYRAALRTHGFRPFAGDDGKWQPPDLADLFMHETVAAWVRQYFRKHPVVKNQTLAVNEAAVIAGLKACEKFINEEYDVESLCSSMPRRVEEIRKRRGDRLKY